MMSANSAEPAAAVIAPASAIVRNICMVSS